MDREALELLGRLTREKEQEWPHPTPAEARKAVYRDILDGFRNLQEAKEHIEGAPEDTVIFTARGQEIPFSLIRIIIEHIERDSWYSPWEQSLKPKVSQTINWDLANTDIPFYNQIIKNPEYCEREKGVKGEIEYMSPKEYMERAAKIFNAPLSRVYDAVSGKLASKYKAEMERGDVFPIPVLDMVKDTQEGRHRVFAALMLGVKSIPVLIVYPAEREKMPRIDPHASALKQDKQAREQRRWLKEHGFETAREAQEAGY